MTSPQQITKKQTLILNLLQQLQEAVSAQELHRRLKDQGYGMGLATVYRGLEALKQQGAIKAIITPTGETVYSALVLDRHHLYCLSCGHSFPIETCPLEALNIQLPATYKFHIYYHSLDFYGICDNCWQKKHLDQGQATESVNFQK
ncbi:MAG: transcriptional repressor [Pseudanabaenaceae cyanobacterium SKYGB_i_bin29]|nr:transcriptional repressor [Pseudanabaenaceae cyanobacterium SKYG29]MDW8420597.1 transcriptional repressor [Pseudanabaenaceae cyanobacterium SKYGB_i_bin29]